MLSAPAHMPATRLITLPAGFAPVVTPRSTCRRISVGSSHRSARRTTGTSPADAIRFGSENDAETVPGGMRRLHRRDAFSNWLNKALDKPPFFQVRRHLVSSGVDYASRSSSHRWIQAQG